MDEQHEGDKILHEDAVKEVVEEVLAEQSGGSVPDSRYSLYGNTRTPGSPGLAIFGDEGHAGEDITLSVDGKTITFETEGLYSLNKRCSSSISNFLGSWTFDFEATGGDAAGSLACMIHRFAAGDTIQVQMDSDAGNQNLNICRLT